MSLKPRHKRRIIWGAIIAIATLALSIVIIPPMITLNKFRPALENAIFEQTLVPAKLDGDINFSLLGGATIVAHDVSVPTARIGSVMLSIPFSSIFKMPNIQLKNTVTIYDADIDIKKLAPASFNHNIKINNSNITFMGRKFHIIRAEFRDGQFNGVIRTDEHKYDVKFYGDSFEIKNKNNNLEIYGQIYTDGTIRGKLSFETYDIGSWIGFGHSQLPIHALIKVTTNFEWDGGTAYKFTNIVANKFTGDIILAPDGHKTIKVRSQNIDYDYSFLLKPGRLLYNANIDLDFYGKITLGDRVFNHIRINTSGDNEVVQIKNIIADDIVITGGTLDANGAHNLMVNQPLDGHESVCFFTGNTTKWECTEYSYKNTHGKLFVDNNKYYVKVHSRQNMQSHQDMLKHIRHLGTSGRIDFDFADISGTHEVNGEHIKTTYRHVNNQTLAWFNVDMPFLPSYMFSDIGNFVWETKDKWTFTPKNENWSLTVSGPEFNLSGKSIKSWFPEIDTTFMNDMPYTMSGKYSKNTISDLKFTLGNHTFSGSVSGKNITLSTPVLNLDTFVSQEYLDNYDEYEFTKNTPIITLFNLPFNISLSANRMIYHGNEYANFVYSLKDNDQIFSITDSSRGNLLATLERKKTNYEIFIQLNRFVTSGYVLSSDMPLNIRDSVITAEIHMNTHGKIAHDIWYNMNGEMDLLFEDGYLIGLSTDDFYASAQDISILNAEDAISFALEGGISKLKNLHIIGKYKDGDFQTTEPFTASLRHTDITGLLEIKDGLMTSQLKILMRGTSPDVKPINMIIMPNGNRRYLLSEIMPNFDPEFLRAFTLTHDKF